MANKVITLSKRVWNSGAAFSFVGQTHTDSQGRYSFVQAPSISYDFRLSFAGDADNAAAPAVDKRVRVAHGVTESLSATSAPAGSTFVLTARPLPLLANGKTYLQLATPVGIRTLGPHSTSSSGTVAYTIKAPAAGTSQRYRVRVPGAASYIDGFEAWLTIRGS